MTNNEELAKWSLAYQLPQHIAAHPSQLAVVQSSIPVRASLFEAYVGAVFSESGLDLVSHWVKLLVRRVLELDDIAQRTPRSELSPLPRRPDSDIETDDMDERILLRLVDGMSIAESDSTRVGGGIGSYGPGMNQFRTRSIAPSSHDGSLNTPASTTTSWLNAANVQPIPVATGRSGPLKNEIRDYGPGRYSPNFPGHHSPSQLPFAPNSQYTPDTRPNVSSHTHHNSGQSPPLLGSNGSNRSSSSSTVRPPERTPQDSPSTRATVASPQPSSSLTSPSSSNSTSSGSGSGQSDFSTRSVAGGFLALFNQMATQKKEKVEWKISSSGPPHKPRFDAQVFSKCSSFLTYICIDHHYSHSSRLLSREGSSLDQKAGPADCSRGSSPKSRLGVSFYLTGCELQLMSHPPVLLAADPRANFGLRPVPTCFGRVRTSVLGSIKEAGY